MLKTEWDYFRSNLADWSKDHNGSYVLVQKKELAGFFPSFHDAVVAGYERLGNTPFLVRRVDPSTEGILGEADLEADHGPDHGQ